MYGRIVCTSVPRLRSNDEIIEAKEEFLLRGGNLMIKIDSCICLYMGWASKADFQSEVIYRHIQGTLSDLN